ncbi:hypothetical protein [Streptomyces variegatus]|uniref:hypothetical protein n=1 Tax=Streptomyces variegatus TaxID=284040 RepID=UPI003C2C31BC
MQPITGPPASTPDGRQPPSTIGTDVRQLRSVIGTDVRQLRRSSSTGGRRLLAVGHHCRR